MSLGFVLPLTLGMLMVDGSSSAGLKLRSQPTCALQMHSARSPDTSCSIIRATSHGDPMGRQACAKAANWASPRDSRCPRLWETLDVAMRRCVGPQKRTVSHAPCSGRHNARSTSCLAALPSRPMFLTSLRHLHFLYAQVNLTRLPLARRGPRSPRRISGMARGRAGGGGFQHVFKAGLGPLPPERRAGSPSEPVNDKPMREG